nr:MAG TPA: hypothetical protein [Caudoviricetes sp.]
MLPIINAPACYLPLARRGVYFYVCFCGAAAVWWVSLIFA